MSALSVAVGTVIAGRYALGARIGTGGMGAVYEAVHIVTGRPCAIKLMFAHTADREEMRARFFGESRALAQIHSEYIVSVLDAGIDPDTHAPFLVMERLTGIDLGQLVTARGALPSAEVLLYLWHAAHALDKTHRASIVHRDLKASNLFLTQREDGAPLVKVLDFGLAKMMRLDGTGDGGTQAVGTPLYMAPEQFRGNGRVSPATDIYALGMLAYLLLVGKHYWRDERDQCENPFAFARIAADGPVEPASVRAARCGVLLPETFDSWFRHATAARPEDRFASASTAVKELAAALGVRLPLPAAAAAGALPSGGTELPRLREPSPEYYGRAILQHSGVGLSPAISFTQSQLSGDGALALSPDSGQSPPSASSSSSRPFVARRSSWPAVGAAALLAAGIAAAALFGPTQLRPKPLGKAFAKSPSFAVAQPMISQPPAMALPPMPADPPLTPADLELVSSEPEKQRSERRRATQHRPLAGRARPQPVRAPETSAADLQSTESAGAPAEPLSDRAALYKRD
jgi:serine/threonine-protein kinase